MSQEHLLLKWGTLKGWNFEGNEKAMSLLQQYGELGCSASAMLQRDSEKQQELLCDMIDAVDGEIVNDWSGETMTKDEAKKYVLEYRKAPAKAEGDNQ